MSYCFCIPFTYAIDTQDDKYLEGLECWCKLLSLVILTQASIADAHRSLWNNIPLPLLSFIDSSFIHCHSIVIPLSFNWFIGTPVFINICVIHCHSVSSFMSLVSVNIPLIIWQPFNWLLFFYLLLFLLTVISYYSLTLPSFIAFPYIHCRYWFVLPLPLFIVFLVSYCHPLYLLSIPLIHWHPHCCHSMHILFVFILYYSGISLSHCHSLVIPFFTLAFLLFILAELGLFYKSRCSVLIVLIVDCSFLSRVLPFVQNIYERSKCTSKTIYNLMPSHQCKKSFQKMYLFRATFDL